MDYYTHKVLGLVDKKKVLGFDRDSPKQILYFKYLKFTKLGLIFFFFSKACIDTCFIKEK